MGDMGDIFNDMKDMRRMRGQERLTEFRDKRADVEDAITKVVAEEGGQVSYDVDASGTFNVRLVSPRGPLRGRRFTVQFYPTKGSWQVRGRMLHGGLDAFTVWITKSLRKVL